MSFKTYNPQEIECKWREKWEENRTHKTGNDPSKPKFYCLDMFPYPSGDGLHVGHWRGYVLSDVWSRYKKLQGYNVLHPMGWDAFGLPAENDAIKKGIHPQESANKNISNFKRQLIEMGAMYDWDREVNTSDPEFYKFTQWIFLQMYKRGLAYRMEMPINWCPSCKTGLANEEVVDGRCERCETEITKKPLDQWMLKITHYADRLLSDLDKLDWPEKVKKMQTNWIGRSEGLEIKFPVAGLDIDIKVFTTCADTIFDVTSIVIAPEHPLTLMVTTPEQKKEVDAYVTAAMRKSSIDRMAQRNSKTGVFTGSYAINPVNNESIPVWVSDYILMDCGTGAEMGVPESDGSQKADIINNLYKSGHAEPKVSYKLRDWVFSRQRYWGEPIPIIHCKDCGEVPVPDEDLPVILPYVEKYQPSGTGESPLATMDEWVNVPCPKCGKPAKRETNTMPQWAGSSWYFLRYCDPNNSRELIDRQKADYWMPVDFYIGGNEHAILHLLYARFFTKFLYDINVVNFDEPFTRLFNIGMINKDGYKMSKSKPNCVSSDVIVNKYGADTLRLYEIFMGPPEQNSDWNESGIEGVFRFLCRVWIIALKSIETNPVPKPDILKEIDKLVEGVVVRLESQKVNTAISLFMSFINFIAKEHPEGLDKDSLGKFITLLSPFVPHFAEEVWELMGNDRSIFESGHWPDYDPNAVQESIIEIPIQINGKVRGTIVIDKDASKDEVFSQAKASGTIRGYFESCRVCKEIYIPGKVVNFVVK